MNVIPSMSIDSPTLYLSIVRMPSRILGSIMQAAAPTPIHKTIEAHTIATTRDIRFFVFPNRILLFFCVIFLMRASISSSDKDISSSKSSHKRFTHSSIKAKSASSSGFADSLLIISPSSLMVLFFSISYSVKPGSLL